MIPTPAQTTAYYTAAVLGLRALDASEATPRRFGPQADARWSRFRGALHTGDRLEVLLRDAAAAWGVAFAAAKVFQLPGVATDEPFGAGWETPNPRQAERYLTTDAPPTLSGCARVLSVAPTAIALPPLRPTTRLAVAGGAAILAVAAAFQGRGDLDWATQVTVVADDPTPRQLAGLASLFVGALEPCPVVPSATFDRAEGVLPVTSADAEPACVARLAA